MYNAHDYKKGEWVVICSGNKDLFAGPIAYLPIGNERHLIIHIREVVASTHKIRYIATGYPVCLYNAIIEKPDFSV